jgi:hypothetical protein
MIESGRETWSLAIRVEHRLGVFENSAEVYLDLTHRRQQEDGENCLMRSFIISPLRQI